MDFGAFPPEVNSARIYAGPGSAPMLAAASAWGGLAAELRSAAAGYHAEVTGLTGEGWTGPAAARMTAAAEPYLAWMQTTAAQAEETAAKAAAAAAAFEEAFAMTVPPPVIAANRAQLASLVATNFLGLNTAAIAATEAHYSQMWAQDAAAMYGYAGAAAAATNVTPFTGPPQTVNPAAPADQSAAVAQATASTAAANTQTTLAQMISTTPSTLQGLASPLQSGASTASTSTGLFEIPPGDLANAATNLMSSSFSPMGIAGITQAGADVAVMRGAALAAADPLGLGAIDPLTMLLPSLGGHGLGGGLGAALGSPAAAAAVGQASSIGALSVPQSWAAATPVANAATASSFPATGWTVAAHAAEPGGMPGMPGVPLAGAGAGRGYGFAAPRYGFKPTVMGRPVVAG